MVFLGIGKSIKKAIFPPKPLPATVAFDKLPSAELSDGYKAPGNVNFSLETISGGFSNLPTGAKVFAIGHGESSFGDLERIKIKAEEIGFRDPPVEISPGVFKFVDRENENKTLTVESLTENFTMQTDFATDPEIINIRPESDKTAIDAATRFFERYDLDLSDFPADKIETRKLRIDGGNLTETPALSNANLIEVNFHRGDMDSMPVFWARKNEAEISALVSASDVVQAKVNVIGVLKHKFATYPLKDPAKAFEELKKGAAFFNQPVTSSQVAIIDVSVGYVLGEKTKDFLQPVYLFKGADGLFGYVGAVDDIWLNGSSSK